MQDREGVMVNKYPVIMYTKDRCPYCIWAKKELNDDGIFFVERNFSDEASVKPSKQGLADLTHCNTVPQIFVCGRFIGGYNEMHNLRGNLPRMIEQCSSDGKTFDKKNSDSSKSKI
ncbi:glutaredoxin [Teladorsagia circumcincta]|uniref:Glutaredoxin n=1 Tax=Teladorsagia circumcincta TaxID=45464 RepID=A0A2G9UZ41_TELCI|nr:glutaredoxin [Teladorsagia circumcincta]